MPFRKLASGTHLPVPFLDGVQTRFDRPKRLLAAHCRPVMAIIAESIAVRAQLPGNAAKDLQVVGKGAGVVERVRGLGREPV
jgi:hypothetical protein